MGFFGCDFCFLNFAKINSLVYGNGTLFLHAKNAGMCKFGNEKKTMLSIAASIIRNGTP
jgi:hypothetical protein